MEHKNEKFSLRDLKELLNEQLFKLTGKTPINCASLKKYFDEEKKFSMLTTQANTTL